MGTPIPIPAPPPPVGPGDDCSDCWGPGKPFGDFPTPIQVTVTVTGVEKGPNWVAGDGDPPNGSFDCPQFGPAFPCFFFSGGFPNIGPGFSAANTVITGRVGSGELWFSGVNPIPCVKVVSSTLNDHFKNGTATITIPGV